MQVQTNHSVLHLTPTTVARTKQKQPTAVDPVLVRKLGFSSIAGENIKR